jgi:hypothetical protein
MKAQMQAQPRRSPTKTHWEVSQWVRFHTRQETVQLIYAHLPPAVILATGQHLLAQAQIEQRAHQIWLASNSRAEDTLNNWLRAEREVVDNLCAALSQKHIKEPESDANLSLISPQQ